METVSRLVNALTGGTYRELWCTRAYRNRWRICRLIDWAATKAGAPAHHCRRCAVWEAWKKRKAR